MAMFLSEDWLRDYTAAHANLPELDGVDAVIQYIVTGAPNGKVQFHEAIESGRVSAATMGKTKDAQITITWKYEEAVAQHSGARSVEVAYMAARSKIEGDHYKYLMELLPMRRTEQYQAASSALATATSY